MRSHIGIRIAGMKKKALTFVVIIGFIFVSQKSTSSDDVSVGVSNTLEYYSRGVSSFVVSNQRLNDALRAIDTNDLTTLNARNALRACRLDFKKIEFFTNYFFLSETRFFNAAPKFEVEEPTLELVEPMGLQQIESLLHEDDVLASKSLLLEQSAAMLSSAMDLKSLLYGFKASDAQILESLRIELIRLSVLSISGYDAPLLKSGVEETEVATEAIQEILRPYTQAHPIQGNQVNELLKESMLYLKAHPDFDTFNRMEYLTKFALPLQKQMGLFIKQQNLEINTTRVLNYNAEHIYKENALNGWNNSSDEGARNKALAALGQKLFSDKSLSGNLSISCASCHKPDNSFSDLLPKSKSIQPDSVLKRNTPTLLYAGWQHSQFWDGSATGLQDQILQVMFNPLEMNGSKDQLKGKVLGKETYRNLAMASFPDKELSDMGAPEISEALAAFVTKLSPMDSPFDQYINGRSSAMTSEQIRGFNLFLGKAQCGTCHFPPYFNSLLPPLYELSEVEVLGTPKTDDLTNPELDGDQGRYDLFQIRYYKGAFKTPTVRNAAKTAPYMHNGSFNSLDKVIEFYNQGGGRGLGLDITDQTLSSKPLNLSKDEISALISFIDALTDSNSPTTNYLN